MVPRHVCIVRSLKKMLPSRQAIAQFMVLSKQMVATRSDLTAIRSGSRLQRRNGADGHDYRHDLMIGEKMLAMAR